MYKRETSAGIILVRDEPIEVTVTAPTAKHLRALFGESLKLGTKIAVSIDQLTPQSNMRVTAICPECGTERGTPFSAITSVGHSYCQPCRQRQTAYGKYIGQNIGRLTITGFAPPVDTGDGGNRTTLSAVCDCGNEIAIWGQSVTRAVRKGSVLSCGCFSAERMRQQGHKNAGPNNGMYDPTLTDEQRVRRIKRRKIQKAKNWARAVRRRDGACVVCGGPAEVAHHLNGFAHNPKQRYSLENGIALCDGHHVDFHARYMGNATKPCHSSDTYRYLQDVHGWDESRVNHLIQSKNLTT